MHGRIFLCFFALPLTLVGAGCINSQQKTVTTSGPTGSVLIEETPRTAKKADGPKKHGSPAAEIAFGEMKEGEADSPAGKANPEAQAQLRDEARRAYQKAIQLDANNLNAQRHLARLYVKTGDYERAQNIYRTMLAKHPNDAGLWFDFGMCQNRRRDFNESVRCLSKAVELDPENREYCNKLGFTLAWVGNVDQALTYLSRAHGIGMAHYRIACVLDQKNQRDSAVHHCRLARRETGEMLDEARQLLAALEGASPAPSRGNLNAPVSAQ